MWLPSAILGAWEYAGIDLSIPFHGLFQQPAKARILELPALSEEIETEETEAAADLEVSDEDDGV